MVIVLWHVHSLLNNQFDHVYASLKYKFMPSPGQGVYFIETIYQILTGAGWYSLSGAGWYWLSVYLIVVQVHAKLRLACPFYWDPLPDTYRGWVIFNYCGRWISTFWGWVILINVCLIEVQVHAKPRTRCPFYWDSLPDTYRGWVIFNYCGRVNINFLGLGDIDKCMPHWGTSSCQTQGKVSILLRQFTRYWLRLAEILS
jgi:hypothetical protein